MQSIFFVVTKSITIPWCMGRGTNYVNIICGCTHCMANIMRLCAYQQNDSAALIVCVCVRLCLCIHSMHNYYYLKILYEKEK